MNRGSILIYSLLTMSVILAISLSLNAAFLRNLGNIREAQDSVRALYASDGGVEYCLFEARTGNRATAFLDAVDESSDCSVVGDSQTDKRETTTDPTGQPGGANQPPPPPPRTTQTQTGPECVFELPADEADRSASFKIVDLTDNGSPVYDCSKLQSTTFGIRTTGTFRSANRSIEITF